MILIVYQKSQYLGAGKQPMLRINRRTDYAVRIMLALAKHSETERVSSQTIQHEMLVPHAFLQRIIADLARHDLLLTFPGPNGGIQLAHPIESITLRDVYEAIEGLESPGVCPLDTTCPVHRHWCRLQAVFIQELQNISLKQLAIEAKALAKPNP
jgi:Rrf2 family protein